MAVTSHDPGGLQAGDFPILTRPVTIVSGQDLKRGAVLGKITTGGKYTLSLSAAMDGSEVPKAILAVDCDASGGDKVAPVLIAGDFADDALTYGAGHTAATVNAAFEAAGVPMVIRPRV